MTTKVKTLKLTSGWGNDDKRIYRVEQITESTEFEPGRLLEKREVDALCAAADWRVTIVGFK